ncbi:nudix hydrolase [Yersinia phage JC221]|nr:nudix hydrolase [Yersinia phage JC221]
MELSAGILFIKDNAVFMGHATETPHWDIPKGRVEPGESHYNAAVRECYEETGFVVKPEQLESLGIFDYSKDKNLALFIYKGDNFPVEENCDCISTFVSHGRTITEMDDYKYVPFDLLKTHARPNMHNLLSKILG